MMQTRADQPTMPELPEVETVRRGLTPVMEGARIDAVELRRPDLRFPFPEGFVQMLVGKRIGALERRAKYLLVRLEDGPVLVMHLGMSGRFRIAGGDDRGHAAQAGVAILGRFHHDAGALQAHDHVVFHLDGGHSVHYNDPRRFGFMTLIDAAQMSIHPMFRDLGPEPIGAGISAQDLAARAKARTQPLKSFLMDQRNVAGLGNIYVCEALFRARLSPMRRAACLANGSGGPSVRARRLAAAIPEVLNDAIMAGGSSLRDHRQTDGSMGYFQHSFSVYGRAGEACVTPGCGEKIRRVVQNGRSSFYCPRCQR